MTKSKIYYLDSITNNIHELEETDFLTEVDMQELLANYPNLIPGDQIDEENPRNWLFVGREISVPSKEDEKSRWSLDHLFIDQDGIPTFVECKRATDTRARREVVAQMLDYAANGIQYWNLESLSRAAIKTAQESGSSLEEKLLENFGIQSEEEIEEFWQKVSENLSQHKIRLIFIADTIHRELKRMVEFLNEEMKNVTVIAVELKQYQVDKNSKNRALIPKVIGLTEKAKEQKSHEKKKGLTNKEEFLSKCNNNANVFYKHVFEKAKELDFFINWGVEGFSIRKQLNELNKKTTVAICFPEGTFQFYFYKEWTKDSEEIEKLKMDIINNNKHARTSNYAITFNVSKTNFSDVIKLFDKAISVRNKHLNDLNETQ